MVLHNNNLPDTEEYVANREVREICENLCGREDVERMCDDRTADTIMHRTHEAIVQTLLAKATVSTIETGKDPNDREKLRKTPGDTRQGRPPKAGLRRIQEHPPKPGSYNPAANHPKTYANPRTKST